jgi:hypothetical protein
MTTVLTILPGPLGQHYQRQLSVLEARGVRVIAEESAAAVVSVAGVGRPDVVVIGRSVPGMDAIEMAGVLCRQHGPKPAVVILPDPGERLDPLICTPSTGFFSVHYCPLDEIWMRITQLCGLRPRRTPPMSRTDRLARSQRQGRR